MAQAQAKRLTHLNAIKLLSAYADGVVRELRSCGLQDIMLAGVSNSARTKLPERALQAAAKIKELKSKAASVLLQFSGRPAEQLYLCEYLLTQSRMPDDKRICLNYFFRKAQGDPAMAIGSLAGFVMESKKPGVDLNAALKGTREDYSKAGIRGDWWINVVDRAVFTKREWQSLLQGLAAKMCGDGLISESRHMRMVIKKTDGKNTAEVLQQEAYRDWRSALRAEIAVRHKQCKKDILARLEDHDNWCNLRNNLAISICLGRIDPIQGQKHTDSVYTHTDAITKVREWELISMPMDQMDGMYSSIPPANELGRECRYIRGVFAVRESLLRGIKGAIQNNKIIERRKWPLALRPAPEKMGGKRGILCHLPGIGRLLGRARAA